MLAPAPEFVHPSVLGRPSTWAYSLAYGTSSRGRSVHLGRAALTMPQAGTTGLAPLLRGGRGPGSLSWAQRPGGRWEPGQSTGQRLIQLPGHRAPRALLSPIELKSQAGLGCPEGRGSEHGQAEVDTPSPREQGEPLCPLQPALYT